jgi:hypothetical protein
MLVIFAVGTYKYIACVVSSGAMFVTDFINYDLKVGGQAKQRVISNNIGR